MTRYERRQRAESKRNDALKSLAITRAHFEFLSRGYRFATLQEFAWVIANPFEYFPNWYDETMQVYRMMIKARIIN